MGGYCNYLWGLRVIEIATDVRDNNPTLWKEVMGYVDYD
jgi:hypothetical protein